MRAIAVAMVLLFHFRIPGGAGGFAGVDVFFVLSGYLMTSILAKTENISMGSLVGTFYARRIWRIAPAYLVTLLIVIAGAAFYMLPEDYSRLGASAQSALTFTSNIFFTSEAGYFSGDAINKPLLHTWSLGVEMQFYLIWPVLYIFVRGFSLKLQAVFLIAGAVVSFIGAVIATSLDPEAAFYAMPTRLWEFCAGSLLANSWVRSKIPSWTNNNLLLQGFAILSLLGFMAFGSEQLAWPAPYGLIAVLATAVLIATNISPAPPNGTSIVTRTLSSSPFVWLGEISYSLYLVHWPITCLIFFIWAPEPSLTIRASMMLLCIPIAYGLYRFIETPMRNKPNATGSVYLRPAVLVGLCCVIFSVGLLIRSNNGYPQRYPTSLQAALVGKFPLNKLPNKSDFCNSGDFGCRAPLSTGKSVFLWGDSHARQFQPSIAQLAHLSGHDFSANIMDACPPLPNAGRSDGAFQFKQECLEKNLQTFEMINSDPNISTVVIAARWAYYANSTRVGMESGKPIFIARSSSDQTNIELSLERLETELRTTADTFSKNGKKVVFVLQAPEHLTNSRRCFLMAKLGNIDLKDCNISEDAVDQRQRRYRAVFDGLVESYPDIKIIDPHNTFCTSTKSLRDSWGALFGFVLTMSDLLLGS